ncbi:MAG: hypothetical protein JOZ55_05740, partial [Alphaproteobacteria bacterium]|nr:hypothetical protein [Alphaproteobacteria bacterium]
VDGYNADSVVVEFVGLSEPSARGSAINYQLTLLGPPPTRGNTELEQDLQAFVDKALHCTAGPVLLAYNDRQSAPRFEKFFEDRVRRIRLSCLKTAGRDCRPRGG